MRPGRRAWPAIPGVAEIARPLNRILRRAILPNLRCFRIDVPHEPMGPGPAGRVRIVYDQSEILNRIGKILDAQRRVHIGTIARIFSWDFPAVGKRAARHFQRRSSRILSLRRAVDQKRERNEQE